MNIGFVKVRDWFIDKTQITAKKYNTFIDVYSRNEDGVIISEDGYYTVKIMEVLSESEKAIQVVLGTGDIVGSYKGWKTWLPKSVIKCE